MKTVLFIRANESCDRCADKGTMIEICRGKARGFSQVLCMNYLSSALFRLKNAISKENAEAALNKSR